MKQDIKTLWQALANNKKNSARSHTQYCILRAMQSKGEDKIAIAKHLIRKAFTPITRVTKLANGRTPFDTIQSRIYRLGWHPKSDLLGVPFADLLTEEEQEQYVSLIKALNTEKLVRRYSYFFGRQDYFDEYQAVQIAHVALELGNKLTPEQIKELHFTVCGVEDLRALEDVERALDRMKIPYVTFREPDIGNQKTAIGVYPLEEHKRGILRNYNLLRFKRDTLRQIVDEMIDQQESQLVEETHS